MNATVPLTCKDSTKPFLNLETLMCVADCSLGQLKVTLPNHEWNNGAASITICRSKNLNYLYHNADPNFYVDVLSTKVLELGTMEFPYKVFTKPFVELFNFYESYPNAQINIYLNANLDLSSTRTVWNFK